MNGFNCRSVLQWKGESVRERKCDQKCLSSELGSEFSVVHPVGQTEMGCKIAFYVVPLQRTFFFQQQETLTIVCIESY